MAQKSEGIHCKDTLFQVDDEAELPQPLKNQAKDLLMNGTWWRGWWGVGLWDLGMGWLRLCGLACNYMMDTNKQLLNDLNSMDKFDFFIIIHCYLTMIFQIHTRQFQIHVNILTLVPLPLPPQS